MSDQLTLSLTGDPAYGAEDFLVAAPNAQAVGWLDRWPDWPGNGLLVHGPSGCGKTHIAHIWQAKTGARLIKCDDLTTASVPDLAASDIAIDDCDDGCCNEAALLHLYNLACEQGHSLLLTAQRPAARWPIALPDLASRLRALAAVEVHEPDDALLTALLVKLFQDRQLRVGEEVVKFLTVRMNRSFATATRLVAAIDQLALSGKQRITVPLAAETLRRLNEQDLGD